MSDADLLTAIRADLERSPWSGEGHRKIWARLRVLDGLRAARTRVLRLMRENGLTPSYAFVGQPETNGVIERFFKTLKEQVVYGRIFQNIEEVRAAVRDFIARYNAEWLIEKTGYLSPRAMRQKWDLEQMSMAA